MALFSTLNFVILISGGASENMTRDTLRKFVLQIIDLMVTPFVTLTVTIFLMLFVLGPITHTGEVWVSDFIVMLVQAPLGIGYILFTMSRLYVPRTV